MQRDNRRGTGRADDYSTRRSGSYDGQNARQRQQESGYDYSRSRSSYTERPSGASQRRPAEASRSSTATRARSDSQAKRRRRTKAARAAYFRAGGIAAALLLAAGGCIYGITHIISADADQKPDSSATVIDNSSTPDTNDLISSSTVTALSGKKLDTIIAQRLAAGADNVITDPSQVVGNAGSAPDASGEPSGEQNGETSSATNTAKTGWGSFDAASVGGTGQGNIASWKAQNSDVVGWLRIPNTNINYPVVVGPDNLYYAEKGYDKNYSYYGVIWADSDTKFGSKNQISQNTVLYGHNWTNYTANPFITRASDIMFGQLPSFHYLNFCKSTPYIHYSTESSSMTWKVFAVFYTEESFNYIVSDPGASGLQYIINEAKARSLHDFDVDVNSSDKILTLSTCTRAYGQTSQQRFVVMARLMRDGESITEVGVTANNDFKRPQL